MMTPARIVIVEDDRIVARDIQQQLGRIGHEVVGKTANGREALALALSSKCQLVLMDIRLEGASDGIDAARQIRDKCRVPVIFLTAYADDETVSRASLTEPFGYLLKPFEESQLRTVIEMALYKHAAEQKLRDSERRFVTTLSSIGDAVIATDNQGWVTFMNPVAETLTGWPSAESVGRPLSDVFRIINEETRKVVEDPAVRVLRTGTVVGLANHTLLIARNGHQIPIDDCGSPIIDDEGNIAGAVLVFRDVGRQRDAETALRKAQAELVQVARLTTMGELAASIAHEINQPLMAIVTNAETCALWLARETPNLEEARKAAERVVANGHRAGDVIKSIRGLLQNSPPERVRLDIHEVLVEVFDLLRPELRQRNVSLETRFFEGAALVVGSRIQLQQVIVNLAINGIEAMNTPADRPRILTVLTEPDVSGGVITVIEDTGIGIDVTKTDLLFEPFFTTKSGGMGMGLSICRSIVEAHGGRLWASPRIPFGSTFRFALPAPADAADGTAASAVIS
jgi:PAS domain S-box-containing protein